MSLRATAFLIGGALLGCDATTSPEASRPWAGTVALNRLGDGHWSTSGGGVIDLTAAAAGFAQTQFSATRHEDGHVTGTFRQVRFAEGLVIDFAGEVTCVSVDPVNHRAWIGGVVTQNNSTHASFLTTIHEVGDDVWFRVVDYGEGSTASQADRSTVYGFRGAAGILTSPEYCSVRPWPGPPTDLPDARTFPLSEGNVQVKP